MMGIFYAQLDSPVDIGLDSMEDGFEKGEYLSVD